MVSELVAAFDEAQARSLRGTSREGRLSQMASRRRTVWRVVWAPLIKARMKA